MDLNTVWSAKDLIMAGLAYTVMGILIVFAILVIIMFVIKAMALFSGEKKPKAVAQAPVQTPAPEVVEEKADESEIIAAITAAIAVVTEKSTSDFVVRSYKKISGGAWNKAGRREMLENRF